VYRRTLRVLKFDQYPTSCRPKVHEIKIERKRYALVRHIRY